MSILIFFLLALAFLGFAIFFMVTNNDPSQWWVWLVLLLCGVGALVRALYGLNEETDCISNLFKKKSKQPATKQKQRLTSTVPLPKPRKERISLTDMMLRAHKARGSCTDAQFEAKILSLITPALDEYKAIYKTHCAVSGVAYEQDRLLSVYQLLLIYLTRANGSYTHREHETYTRFCKAFGMQPLSTEEIGQKYKNGFNEMVTALSLLLSLRPYINPKSYANLAQGFCCFALYENRVYHENHYHVLVCFFEKGFDTFPETWEQQKKEY